MTNETRSEEVHHYHDNAGGSGPWFFLGIIALILFAFLIFYYGIPALRNVGTAPQINVPGQIDVNIQERK